MTYVIKDDQGAIIEGISFDNERSGQDWLIQKISEHFIKIDIDRIRLTECDGRKHSYFLVKQNEANNI